tara:strand:+ start:3423 stop:3632 length:210 start_codon:yes stop_codon:yes gene_type:complete
MSGGRAAERWKIYANAYPNAKTTIHNVMDVYHGPGITGIGGGGGGAFASFIILDKVNDICYILYLLFFF